MSEPSAAPEPAEAPHFWDYWYVLLRHRRVVLAVLAAVTGTALLRTLLTAPAYQATAQILIERDAPSVLSFKDVTPENADWRDDYYQTQFKLIQSRALARRVILDLGLLADPEFGGPRSAPEIASVTAAPVGVSPVMEGAIDALQGRLTVSLLRNSRLMSVTVESGRPGLAARVANRLSELFIEQNLEFRYETATDATAWLARQIEEQRRKVAEAEASLDQIQRQEGLLNMEERRSLVEQRLKELGTALTARKTERLGKEALYQQMASAQNPEELPEVMQSPVVQGLRLEVASLERRRAELLRRYMDQHPEVIKTEDELKTTRERLAAETQRVINGARNDMLAAQAQEASVAAALEAAKAEALDLSRRGVNYETRKRELEAAKAVLASIMAREKETGVSRELKASNIRIVDPAAVPRYPVRPRHARDTLVGLLLGAVLGLAAAFVLEYLDNTLKIPEDVATHLGNVPLLAVIPELKDPSGLLLAGPAPQGPFAEGYRLLRTSLHYSWPAGGSRVISVTSTAPSEGKTLTSTNLAVLLTATGGRVLLIDADMRRPKVHGLLGVSRQPGLSDVLVGDVSGREAIQKGAVAPGLDILTAGAHVPNPADLLTADAMRGLLNSLRSTYRCIVIDTPPVAAVADGLAIAALADGVVVVAGAEMVPRRAVRTTLQRLGATGAHLLGIVLNRVHVERNAYYYSQAYVHYYGSHDHGEEKPAAAASGSSSLPN